MEKLLEVENLKIMAKDKKQTVTIVDNISFNICKGQTLGIIGESGCGKSMTALSIMSLLRKNVYLEDSRIIFKGQNLATMDKKKLRSLCGKDIGMVFQEPMTALNPLFTIGRQLSEAIMLHMKLSKKQANKRSIELLDEVGIKNPESVLKSYPHQFSGGMLQRVVIAIAISCNPSLLIADEPTTALDVVIQAQILSLLKDLIKERNMAMLLISHDFGVISQMADRTLVMYSGEIIEEDFIENIIDRPRHPYTEKLLLAAKELSEGSRELSTVKGAVPRPEQVIVGCKFKDRCEDILKPCSHERPPMFYLNEDHKRVKCWKYNTC